MGSNRRLLCGILVGIGLSSGSGQALAAMDEGNRETVRLLANDASVDYEAGRYAQALDKFQRAYDVAKVPTLALWLAKTQSKLGHLLAALEFCHEATRLERNELWSGDTQQDAQKEAARLRKELQPRVARVIIQIVGIESRAVSISIDDVDVPSSLVGVDRVVDPGERHIVARAGDQVAEVKVELAEGERKEVRLKFGSAEAPSADVETAPDQPQSKNATTVSAEGESSGQGRTWGWMMLAVGAAGLAVGATAGVVVAMKHGDLSEQCPDGKCGRAYWSDNNSYNTWRTVSTVGFIVGAVETAVGVTLLLTSSKQPSESRVGLRIAPTSIGVVGAF